MASSPPRSLDGVRINNSPTYSPSKNDDLVKSTASHLSEDWNSSTTTAAGTIESKSLVSDATTQVSQPQTKLFCRRCRERGHKLAHCPRNKQPLVNFNGANESRTQAWERDDQTTISSRDSGDLATFTNPSSPTYTAIPHSTNKDTPTPDLIDLTDPQLSSPPSSDNPPTRKLPSPPRAYPQRATTWSELDQSAVAHKVQVESDSKQNLAEKTLIDEEADPNKARELADAMVSVALKVKKKGKGRKGKKEWLDATPFVNYDIAEGS